MRRPAGPRGFAVEDAKVVQLHWAHIAETKDQAWDEAAVHFHHLMSVYQKFANASGGEPESTDVLDVVGVLGFGTGWGVVDGWRGRVA